MKFYKCNASLPNYCGKKNVCSSDQCGATILQPAFETIKNIRHYFMLKINMKNRDVDCHLKLQN